MPNNPGVIPVSVPAFGYPGGSANPLEQENPAFVQQGGYNMFPPGPGHPSSVPKWRNSWTPGGPFKLAVIGDSLAQVIGNPGTTVDIVHKMARMFQCLHGLSDGGLGLIPTFWFPYAGSGITKAGNPGLIAGGGYGIGGTARQISAADTFTVDTSTATFSQGTKAVQSMDILYVDYGALNGDIQYKIDGGAVQTLVTAKTGDHATKSVNIPAGAAPVGFAGNTTHSVQILGSGGLGVSFVGVIVYAATTGASGVQAYNGGISGVTSPDYTKVNADGTDALSWISIVQPHMTIISLGGNDPVNVRDVETSKTAFRRLFLALLLNGSDIIFMAPPVFQPFIYSVFPQLSSPAVLEGQTEAVCNEFNVPLLNFHTIWGNPGQYATSGLLGDGLIHPNDLGVQDQANRLYRAMNNA